MTTLNSQRIQALNSVSRHYADCAYFNSTDCCDSCHDDAEAGYEMIGLYGKKTGQYIGEVCCRVKQQYDTEISVYLENK